MTDTEPPDLLGGREPLQGFPAYEPLDVQYVRDLLNSFFEELQTASGATGGGSAADSQRDHAVDLLSTAILGSLRAVVRPLEGVDRRSEAKFRRRIPRRHSEQSNDAPISKSYVVDVGILRDQIKAAFEAANRLLAGAAPPEPVLIHRPLAEDKKLMLRFQDLFTAASLRNGQAALEYIENLREELARSHDIDVMPYNGTNGEFFEPLQTSGPAGLEVDIERPALVSKAGPVLKGVARSGAKPGTEPAAGGEQR